MIQPTLLATSPNVSVTLEKKNPRDSVIAGIAFVALTFIAALFTVPELALPITFIAIVLIAILSDDSPPTDRSRTYYYRNDSRYDHSCCDPRPVIVEKHVFHNNTHSQPFHQDIFRETRSSDGDRLSRERTPTPFSNSGRVQVGSGERTPTPPLPSSNSGRIQVGSGERTPVRR